MKINGKIASVVAIVAILTAAAITVAVVRLAGDTMEADARKYVDLMTERFSWRIRLKVETALERTYGLSRAFAEAESFPAKEGMAFVEDSLRKIVDSSTGVHAAWAILEPTAGLTKGWTGSFVSGSDGTVPGGAVLSVDDPRLKAVVEGGMARVFEPGVSLVQPDDTAEMLDITAPVSREGIVVGLVGIEIPMAELTTMVSAARPWKNSYGFLVSDAGALVVHPTDAILGKQLFEVGGYTSDQESRIKNGILKRALVSITKKSTANGLVSYQSYMPIAFAGTNQVWVFGISVPIDQTRTDALKFAGTTVTIALVVVLLGVLFAVFMGRRISRPIVAVRNAANRMAAERDLSFRVATLSKDETGESIEALERLFAEIRTFVSDTSCGADALRISGEELAAAMEETRATAERIAETVGSVRRLTEVQGASTQEVAASAAQIARRAEDLSATADRQAVAAATSGEALALLDKGAKEVASGVHQLREEFVVLLREAAAGSKRLEAAALANEDIARRSEELVAANNALSQVATSTNLLAMNAAIEAAHAGQYGRGFAIVAQEIRKLAETSAAKSKEIEKSLKEIRTGIHGANDSSSAAREAFVSISGAIGSANAIQQRIGAAVDAQASSLSTALGSVEESGSTARQVAAAATEMRNGGRETATEMGNLAQGGLELLAAMDEIAVGVKAIAEGAIEVTGKSLESKQRIDELVESAASFRSREACEDESEPGLEVLG
jgi:methyl-accepting chemotaxis protein